MKRENFVRHYRATLCRFARKATMFWDMNDTVKRDMSIKGKRFRNRFEWNDFHMTEWEVDTINYVVAGHARISA